MEVEELAPHVCPAGRLGESAGLIQLIEPGVAIGLQNATEATQMCSALPTAAAILRSLKPSSYLSRKTCRILRTGNLACATADLLPFQERRHGSGG